MSSDLNDVVVLVRVVETGSFSGAARRLGVPKSTVSRRIARLERDLGVRLLQRTTRQLSLTDAGKIYYHHCARVLSELEEAQRVVSSMQHQPRGTLRVTAPHDLVEPILADLIAKYERRYPEVSVIAEMTTRFVDLVAEGFDVALRAGTLQDSSLIARRLMTFPMKLYASPAYLEAHGTPERPSDLQRHRCLVLGTDRMNPTWVLTRSGEAELAEILGHMASNDVTLLKSVAVAGMGIVNLPTLTCFEAERAGQLRQVLREYVGGESGVYAVFPSSHQLAAKVRRFVELAAEEMSKLQHAEN